MSIQDKIKELATLDRARAYEATQDKYIYALDTLRHELDLSLPINSDRTDAIVEAFELALDEALSS